MAQTDNPFLDGMARIFTDAAGAAKSVRDEIDTFVKQRLERLVADMDFVPREEFEAVKAMAAKARAENETPRSADRRAGSQNRLRLRRRSAISVMARSSGRPIFAAGRNRVARMQQATG